MSGLGLSGLSHSGELSSGSREVAVEATFLVCLLQTMDGTRYAYVCWCVPCVLLSGGKESEVPAKKDSRSARLMHACNLFHSLSCPCSFSFQIRSAIHFIRLRAADRLTRQNLESIEHIFLPPFCCSDPLSLLSLQSLSSSDSLLLICSAFVDGLCDSERRTARLLPSGLSYFSCRSYVCLCL